MNIHLVKANPTSPKSNFFLKSNPLLPTCCYTYTLLQLDLLLIHTTCWLDVNTKKAKHKIKKELFSVQRLQASHPIHKTNPHNKI